MFTEEVANAHVGSGEGRWIARSLGAAPQFVPICRPPEPDKCRLILFSHPPLKEHSLKGASHRTLRLLVLHMVNLSLLRRKSPRKIALIFLFWICQMERTPPHRETCSLAELPVLIRALSRRGPCLRTRGPDYRPRRPISTKLCISLAPVMAWKIWDGSVKVTWSKLFFPFLLPLFYKSFIANVD